MIEVNAWALLLVYCSTLQAEGALSSRRLFIQFEVVARTFILLAVLLLLELGLDKKILNFYLYGPFCVSVSIVYLSFHQADDTKKQLQEALTMCEQLMAEKKTQEKLLEDKEELNGQL